MVARDEPRERFFRAGPQLLYESCFFRLKREHADKVTHGEFRLKLGIFPSIPQLGHFWHLENTA
jgi:hypothetical protein